MYFWITTLSSGDDHYFHFRFAQLFSERGFMESFRNFQSISVTKIAQGQYFIYYNFLFYLAVIPFATLVPLYLGIKLYAVVIAALVATLLYWCLRQFGLRRPFLWTVGFFAIVGYGSVWRLFLSRPYVLAPALLLLLLVALYKKKYFWAAVVCFAYLFWHGTTFFFPLVVAGAYFVSAHLYTRVSRTRILWWTIGGIAVAMGTAYAISHGFLHYVYDVLTVYSDTVVGKKIIIPEGGELYPVGFFDFVNNNIFFFSLFVISICVQVGTFFHERLQRARDALHEHSERDILAMALFLLAGAFFSATVLVSRRFADFLVVFGWAFVALTVTESMRHIAVAKAILRKLLGLGAGICVAYLFVNNLLQLQAEIASTGNAPEEFEKVGTWLHDHTARGDVIFDLNWSWFPQLYYYSPYNNYVIGLEPRLTYVADARRYWLWFNIGSKGYACGEETCPELQQAMLAAAKDKAAQQRWYRQQGDAVADALIAEFNSRYIVSSEQFSDTNELFDNSDRFEKVYGEGKRYSVYKVVD